MGFSFAVLPIPLAGYFLHTPRGGMPPAHDFSRLPFRDSLGSHHSDVPFLASEVLTQPFADQELHLAAGIHLHWHLPFGLRKTTGIPAIAQSQLAGVFGAGTGDVVRVWQQAGLLAPQGDGRLLLTAGAPAFDEILGTVPAPQRDAVQKLLRGAIERGPDGKSFPYAPNRWLIRRLREGKQEAAWVVESDYLWPEDADAGEVAVSFPVLQTSQAREGRQYRYVGRRLRLEDWLIDTTPAGHYLANHPQFSPLTALGYGEPTFAALYPNCRSVFGFHDADITESSRHKGLSYELWGWYSRATLDYWQTFRRFAEAVAENEAEVRTIVGREFNLELPSGAEPAQMACFARLGFGGDTDMAIIAPAEQQIRVGNSGQEAMSAWLAEKLAPERPEPMADFLASVELDQEELQGPARQLQLLEDVHAHGFRGRDSIHHWKLVQTGPSPVKEGNIPLTPLVPATLFAELRAANALQETYSTNQHKLDDLRQELYADWYRYLLCTYPPDRRAQQLPDIDAARLFIEEHSLPALEQLQTANGTLEMRFDEDGNLLRCRADGADSIALQLADALNKILDQIRRPGQAAYNALRPQAGPRYWQPTEPVLLLSGPVAAQTHRTALDQKLEAVHIGLATAETPDVDAWMRRAAKAGFAPLETVTGLGGDDNPGHCNWAANEKEPLLLDWRVAFHAADGYFRTGQNTDDYDPDFVRKTYLLKENRPDLTLRPDLQRAPEAVQMLEGRTMLSARAQHARKERMLAYCRGHLDAHVSAAKEMDRQDLGRALDALPEDAIAGTLRKQLQTVLDALQLLEGQYFVSQSLGGLYDGLLTQQHGWQLPVADPLAFAPYAAFSARVAAALGDFQPQAPLPRNRFHPVRAGNLELRRLRLIDRFGQVTEVPVQGLKATEPLRESRYPGRIHLPPRLCVPARLQFRWVHNGLSQPDAPDYVYGWVQVAAAERRLSVFSAEGERLGSLGPAGWYPVPGAGGITSPEAIPDLNLRAFANAVLDNNAHEEGFFDALLEILMEALGHIHGHRGNAGGQDGTMLALACARIGFEVKGMPPASNDWNHFVRHLRRGHRLPDHKGFARVRYPIRLGEYFQLEDGLVLFWKAGKTQEFNAPQSDFFFESSDLIHTRHADDPLLLWQSIEDGLREIHMLLVPDAAVHATSGILPTKEIRLPTGELSMLDQQVAMDRFIAPVLSPANSLRLPLATNPEVEWKWVAREAGQWLEVLRGPEFGVMDTQATWPGPLVLREGWLRADPAQDENS